MYNTLPSKLSNTFCPSSCLLASFAQRPMAANKPTTPNAAFWGAPGKLPL
jgi:hypothetical protein